MVVEKEREFLGENGRDDCSDDNENSLASMRGRKRKCSSSDSELSSEISSASKNTLTKVQYILCLCKYAEKF